MFHATVEHCSDDRLTHPNALGKVGVHCIFTDVGGTHCVYARPPLEKG